MKIRTKGSSITEISSQSLHRWLNLQCHVQPECCNDFYSNFVPHACACRKARRRTLLLPYSATVYAVVFEVHAFVCKVRARACKVCQHWYVLFRNW